MKKFCPKNIFLATLFILPLFLTACTLQDLPLIGKFFVPKSGTGAGPVTLKIWGLWEKPEVLQALATKYKETHPNVTIEFEDRSLMKLPEYKDTVFSRSSQTDAPDIVVVHNTWLPKFQTVLSAMPASIMDAATYTQSFYPVAVSSAVIGGKVYALPIFYDGLALVYNKKHFEAVDQKTAPTAWEEFRGLAASLTIKGTDNTLVRGGAAIGNADNVDFFSDILGLFFSQAGVTIPDRLDSRDAIDALTYYTNFVKEDGIWADTLPEASVAFSQEKVSMIFVPSWNLLDIVSTRPDMAVGVAPVPQVDAAQPATWGSFWMYAVPSGSEKKDAAWEFVKFLGSEEGQLISYNEASKIRKYGSPYSVMGLAPQLDNQPYLKPFLDTAIYARSGIITARSGNDSVVSALKEAVNAVLGGQSPADALKAVKASISQAK